MLDCRDATGLMSQGRERRLTLRERVTLRLHWTACSACRRFDRQLDLLQEAARCFAARDDRVFLDRDDTPPR
jgi:hypothetical protein